MHVLMSVLKKLQYMCMFIRLLNEPIRVCAPKLPGFGGISGTLALYLCVHFFVWFCLVLALYVYLCVFMSAFLRVPYQISPVTDSQSTEKPPSTPSTVSLLA